MQLSSPRTAAGGPTAGDDLTLEQRAAIAWLRSSLATLAAVPRPGAGETTTRWEALVALGRDDLARARIAEGHLDALAILVELGAAPPPQLAWGVWAAEPDRLHARRVRSGWELSGEKRWCSGAHGLDRALVTATADDGPRLFVVEPARLRSVPGSWPALGMAATASLTMRFALVVDDDDALGDPGDYVARPGFGHGGAGVAACWFGGALGVAERLRLAVAAHDPAVPAATWGRVRVRLEAVGALLRHAAAEIDDEPHDPVGALHRARRVRLAVEGAARETLTETTTALGASPLAFEREFARRVVDLELYLRQLRPEVVADEYGRECAGVELRW